MSSKKSLWDGFGKRPWTDEERKQFESDLAYMEEAFGISPSKQSLPFLSGRYHNFPKQYELGKGEISLHKGDDSKVFQYSLENANLFKANHTHIYVTGTEDYIGSTSDALEYEHRAVYWMMRRLVKEYPYIYSGVFNDIDPTSPNNFNFVCNKIQEDVALFKVDEVGKNEAVSVHVTCPSFWDPVSILGKNINKVHKPVPELPEIPDKWVRSLSDEGSIKVQFQWFPTTCPLLNHHPKAVESIKPFDKNDPELYIRVERQTLVGLGDSLLFLIRTYLHDCSEMPPEHRKALVESINSLSEAKLDYKGLTDTKDDVCAWLMGDQ